VALFLPHQILVSLDLVDIIGLHFGDRIVEFIPFPWCRQKELRNRQCRLESGSTFFAYAGWTTVVLLCFCLFCCCFCFLWQRTGPFSSSSTTADAATRTSSASQIWCSDLVVEKRRKWKWRRWKDNEGLTLKPRMNPTH
jgi:hypothetical protein